MENQNIDRVRGLVKGYLESLRQHKVDVLVFGPGKGNPDPYAKLCYEKRTEIRDYLKKDGHWAILPEEAFEVAQQEGQVIENYVQFERYLLANSCDIAIFIYLPGCPGVDHELSVLSQDMDSLNKIYCFHAEDRADQWFQRDNLDMILGGGGRLEAFTQKIIEECNVRRRSVELANSFRRYSSFHAYKKYEVK